MRSKTSCNLSVRALEVFICCRIRSYRQQLHVEELGRLLRDAIHFAWRDRETIERWLAGSIDQGSVVRWVDEDVREAWALKAAVTVLGLLSKGCDVDLVGEPKNRKPPESVRSYRRISNGEAKCGT